MRRCPEDTREKDSVDDSFADRGRYAGTGEQQAEGGGLEQTTAPN